MADLACLERDRVTLNDKKYKTIKKIKNDKNTIV